MVKVAVGSMNPAKITAVQKVLGNTFELVAIDAPSFVSEQPIGDEETVT